MNSPSALDILKAARAKIAKPEYWGKGIRGPSGIRPLNTCCAAEAFDDGAYSRSADYEVRTRAAKILYLAAGLEHKDQSIIDWNDAPERTHSEVLSTFNLAIALARNFPRGA